jgi:hypothetical protein
MSVHQGTLGMVVEDIVSENLFYLEINARGCLSKQYIVEWSKSDSAKLVITDMFEVSSGKKE